MQMNPCHFCGETNRLGVVVKWLRGDGYAKHIGAYARCKRCHARGSLVTSDETLDCRNERPTGDIRQRMTDRAVEVWNGSLRSQPADGLPLFNQREVKL